MNAIKKKLEKKKATSQIVGGGGAGRRNPQQDYSRGRTWWFSSFAVFCFSIKACLGWKPEMQEAVGQNMYLELNPLLNLISSIASGAWASVSPFVMRVIGTWLRESQAQAGS